MSTGLPDYLAAVDVLPALPPPTRVVLPALETVEPGRVLVIGGNPKGSVERSLGSRGYDVDCASSLAGALNRLERDAFVAVLVPPTLSAEGDGVRFVRVLKHPRADDPRLMLLASRFRRVPFVLLPMVDSAQYAVFWTHEEW